MATRATNARASAEAQKDRDFQAQMSDTSHQREVSDLMLAGLNPMLSANHGASTPGGAQAQVEDAGQGVSRGIASALALKQMRSQIGLTDAQAERERQSALLARTQAYDMQTSAQFRYSLTAAQAAVAQADAEQRRQMMPFLLDKAKEEVQLTAESSRRASAAAALDELAATGAKNAQAFEQRFGEMGPWTQLLLQVLREVKK